MPRRRADDLLEKVTLNLFHGDLADLQALAPRVGASAVVRALVRRYINDKRGYEKPRIKAVTIEEVEL